MKEILDLNLNNKANIVIETKNIIYWEKHIKQQKFLYNLFFALRFLSSLLMILYLLILFAEESIPIDILWMYRDNIMYILLLIILLNIPLIILEFKQYSNALTSFRVYDKSSIFIDYLSYNNPYNFSLKFNFKIQFSLTKIYINNIEIAIDNACHEAANH